MPFEYPNRRHSLTRRDALALLGAGSVALLSSVISSRSRAQSEAALPRCIVRPEQTEGPFFVEERLNRSDIRADPLSGVVKAGAPLRLTFRVSRIAQGCTPLAGAYVDLWQCDASGAYSDVRDGSGSTVGQKFLRGYQVTDQSGVATFTTIYPGWYRGRAVHVHFKIRTNPSHLPRQEFTSQIYFDDALSDRVHALPAYAGRGRRDRRNHQDGIFSRAGGKQLMLHVVEDAQGYSGTFDIGLSL